MSNLKIYTMMLMRLMSDPMTGADFQEGHTLIPLEQTVVVSQEQTTEEQLTIEEIEKVTLSQMTYFNQVPIGNIPLSEFQLVINEQEYPLYYYQDTNFISTSVLEQIGFSINKTNMGIYITKQEEQQNKYLPIEHQVSKPINMSDKRVYIGNCLTYSFKSGEDYLIPIRSLSDYYSLHVEGIKCFLNETTNTTTDYVTFSGDTLSNQTDYPLNIQLQNVSIGENSIEHIEIQEITLQPKEKIEITYSELQGIQIASLITQVEMIENSEVTKTITANIEQYGQGSEVWYQVYRNNKIITDFEELKKIFPTSRIFGTMKYDSNGFTKGEQVEILRAQSGVAYYVDKGGKEVQIPWNSVDIPSSPKANNNLATTQQIEAYVNKLGLKSDTNYLVWTDIHRQRTYVFTGRVGEWVLQRNMICSTGRNTTPTPKGGFKLRAYVPYFGLDKGYMCKDAVQIYGDYLYHSVMLDPTGTYVLNSNGPLGQQGSQGCIRLSVEDANWFYNTLPLKTTVYIN